MDYNQDEGFPLQESRRLDLVFYYRRPDMHNQLSTEFLLTRTAILGLSRKKTRQKNSQKNTNRTVHVIHNFEETFTVVEISTTLGGAKATGSKQNIITSNADYLNRKSRDSKCSYIPSRPVAIYVLSGTCIGLVNSDTVRCL